MVSRDNIILEENDVDAWSPGNDSFVQWASFCECGVSAVLPIELNMAHTSCAISPVIEWLGRKGCAHSQTGTQPLATWEIPVGVFSKVFSLHIGFLLIQQLAMPYQSC